MKKYFIAGGVLVAIGGLVWWVLPESVRVGSPGGKPCTYRTDCPEPWTCYRGTCQYGNVGRDHSIAGELAYRGERAGIEVF